MNVTSSSRVTTLSELSAERTLGDNHFLSLVAADLWFGQNDRSKKRHLEVAMPRVDPFQARLLTSVVIREEITSSGLN